MSRKVMSKLGLIIAGVLLLAALPLSNACVPKPPEKTIKVGLFAEFTGPIASEAAPISQAVMDYIRYLNEEEGGINGIKIETLWIDVAYDLPKAMTAYERFKEQGVVLTFSSASPYNEGLRTDWEKDEIPAVTVAVSVPALYPPGPIFVERVDYASMFGGFIDWLVGEWWQEPRSPRVALMAWDNPFGRGPFPAIPYAEARGVEIVARESIPFMPTETTTELLRIRDAGADFIFSNIISAPLSVIAKDAYRLGLSTAAGAKITIVGGMQVELAQFMAMAGEAAEGTICQQPTATWQDVDVPGVRLAGEVQEKFHGAVEPAAAYLWGWNMARIGCEGIRIALDEVGYDKLDGAAVWKALESIEDFDMLGIVPPVSYSPTERRGSTSLRMAQMQEGEAVWISDWFECPDLLAESAK